MHNVMSDLVTRIVVVGSGHVGLVAAVCFAEIGHTVVCVDKDQQKMHAHLQGIPTIHEQFLPEMLRRHLHRSLTFTSDLAGAIQDAEAIFIAVGTPQSGNGQTDLSYVESVAREIARSIRRYTVIVEKSTVPIYTNEWIRHLLGTKGMAAAQFDVASNPEFLREGTAVKDFLHPDRIIIGAESARAAEVLQRIYAPLTTGAYYAQADAISGQCTSLNPPPMLRTSAKSAELIKHASNAFLAMKIAFINQVANVCEAAESDVMEVVLGLGMDRRIGPHFLQPGIGYGGSCFSKDIAAFHSVAASVGVDFGMLAEVEKANIQQRKHFFGKVRAALGGLEGKRLAVLGLAFKSGTDDVRESPALALTRMFLDADCIVSAFDPVAMPQAQQALPASERLQYATSEYAAAAGADALVILTDWPQFGALDWVRMRDTLARPLVLDGRNVCQPSELAAQGLDYIGIGRHAGVHVHAPIPLPGSKAQHSPSLEENSTGKTARRALLTGAAGFLGSHLADRLVAEGYHVLGIDNVSTGDLRNLSHLRHESRFDFVEQDICQPYDPGAVDFIFNFACPASPVQYMRRGPETLRVGSEGTHRMLELARRYGATFLQASTSECYGTPQVHPQPESYWGNVNPVGPRSVYDESKRFSEALVMAYHRYHRMDTRLARIFNTYGSRMQPEDGRVISNFIMQALAGRDLTVYGDGLQTRSFCYVSDLVEGILRLAHSQEALPVNLGNPDEYTILACAQQVVTSCQASSKITFEPLPEDDPPQRRPNITKARQLLGWEPKISLQQGLQQTIPYFHSRLTPPYPVAGGGLTTSAGCVESVEPLDTK